MPIHTGSCVCRNIEYELRLGSDDDARMSICHCRNCKKAFGTNYGLTAKVPKDTFYLTKGEPKEHVADNGSGAVIHREFCQNCGSFILEYGTILKPYPRRGEFFCKARASWMPEIPDVFHKQEIKE
ncbi:hypothetical protein N7475_005610 [Penicillium sp. IBT 31633x]|nr:hypothetical protein N7475_005610 [Penicillium sp. IBT 31633x]